MTRAAVHLGYVMTDNLHGLVVNVQASQRHGYAEREVAVTLLADFAQTGERLTVGADKAYDTRSFVQACRENNVSLHDQQLPGHDGLTRLRGWRFIILRGAHPLRFGRQATGSSVSVVEPFAGSGRLIVDMFVLRARLRSPVIQRGYSTLDALLMAVLGRGDVTDLLHCVDGLYHASAGFPVDVIGQSTAAFVASMRPEHTPGWRAVIQPNTRGGDVQIGLTRQREGGNVLNEYKAQVARAVEWYATGNKEAVLEAVQDVAFIGKKRSAGYGEVDRWEAQPGELDGVVGYLGEPLRPVPTERWTAGGDWVPVEAAWKAPYWDVRNRTRCFVPETVA